MTVEFKLPLISEGVEAADIAAVHVHEGDDVEAGQIVLEVETEKAVAEIPSPQAGRIAKDPRQAGTDRKDRRASADVRRSGLRRRRVESSRRGSSREKAGRAKTKLREIRGRSRSDCRRSGGRAVGAAAAAAPKKVNPSPAPAAKSQKLAPEPKSHAKRRHARQRLRPSSPRGRHADGNGHEEAPVPAGPATRRLARELGVDLHHVSGSGPGGRITTDDVQAFVRSLTTSRTLDIGGGRWRAWRCRRSTALARSNASR